MGPSRRGRTLVISDPTLMVRHANGRLVLLRDRKEVSAVPLSELRHVALHGPVTLTGAVMARLLDAGLDVTLHSSSGRFRGMLTSADPGNVYLVLAQASAWNDVDKRLGYARPLVASKLAGQRGVLRRAALDRGSARCAEAAEGLIKLEQDVWKAQDLDVLRGLEGAGSAKYFQVFGETLSEGWTFRRRVRRPATDPVNALLSFGYTLAVGEVGRFLTWGGFDTRIGMLHGLRYGRESLALDVVEEFRAPMVDRFTLRLLNLGQLEREDFEEQEDGAVRLTPDGRRRYLTLWEEMLMKRAPGLRNESEDVGERAQWVTKEGGEEADVTWRHRMERQVNALRRYLLNGAPFEPLQRSRKSSK